MLAVITMQEISTEQWAPVFSTDSSRSGAINTLSNSPVIVKILRQAFPDISSTRKRIARNNLLRTFSYRHFLSCYSTFTPQDFDDKRQELQAAKEDLFKNNVDHNWDLGWYKFSPISSVTFILSYLSNFSPQVTCKSMRLSPTHPVVLFLKKTWSCLGTILLSSCTRLLTL